MKILMLGSGSARSMLTFRALVLGSKLAAAGDDVSLMVPAVDKYNDFQPEPITTLDGVSVIQPWQPATASQLGLLAYMVSSLRTLFNRQYELIYIYKPTPITVLGLLPHALFGTPLVVDLDDHGSEVMRGEGQPAWSYKLVAACERLVIKYASRVIVTSTYLSDMVKRTHPSKQVLILPNGVDAAAWHDTAAATPRNHLYYFGYINRLSLIEPLISALPQVLATCPTAQLTIIGGGSALAAAQQLAESLGVSEHVTFTGPVKMLEAQRYTQFGDIAVCYQPDIPTVRAASNMKVFQYMAMSSVPVVSAVGDLPSYVANHQAGVTVEAGNTPALAAALSELLADPDRRTRLARAARRAAETTYDWANLASTLRDFVAPIVHNPASAPANEESR